MSAVPQSPELPPGDPVEALARAQARLAKVTAAANSLVARRLLLPEDAAFLINQANAAAVP